VGLTVVSIRVRRVATTSTGKSMTKSTSSFRGFCRTPEFLEEDDDRELHFEINVRRQSCDSSVERRRARSGFHQSFIMSFMDSESCETECGDVEYRTIFLSVYILSLGCAHLWSILLLVGAFLFGWRARKEKERLWFPTSSGQTARELSYLSSY
jgi:hypothetical protein